MELVGYDDLGVLMALANALYGGFLDDKITSMRADVNNLSALRILHGK